MKYKPNWPEAAKRWEALWEGRPQDRPVMVVRAPNGKQVERPPEPEDPERKWLDPEYVLPSMRAHFESTYFAGEAIPSQHLMAGWVNMSHCSTPVFDHRTIWFEEIEVDWDQPPSFELDWNCPWVAKFERLHAAVRDMASEDDFMVGSSGGLPGNDMLPMMLSAEDFLIQLLDHPDWMREAVMQLGESRVRLIQHFGEKTRKRNRFWYGNPGWANFWAPEPFVSMQSDVSCMMSPEMFEEFILPELDLESRAFGPIWYHLDGQGSERHLPALLSRDYLRVVQWVPAPIQGPNGPLHFDLYHQIQDAGRIVHITLPKENVESVIRELDPSLLCLEVNCRSVREADELLEAAKSWTSARALAPV